MYQNIWCEKRGGNQVEVHLWDDVAGYQNFIFKNYAYVRDGGGQYRSIYGDKLKKVTYWTEEDFKRYMFREEFTNSVMDNFITPVVWYEDFVEDQDGVMDEIQQCFGLAGVYLENNKKKIIENPDYTEIFTNYGEIESWFR